MSAENCIYIQKRNNRWHVWMGFPLEAGPHLPPKTAAKFYQEADAVNYAVEWLESEAVIEHGIIHLPDMEPQPPVAFQRLRGVRAGATEPRT